MGLFDNFKKAEMRSLEDLKTNTTANQGATVPIESQGEDEANAQALVTRNLKTQKAAQCRYVKINA